MSEHPEVTPAQRLAITLAWRRGECWCGTSAPLCPSCDATPPTCPHGTCHAQHQQRRAQAASFTSPDPWSAAS